MKPIAKRCFILFAVLFFSSYASFAQTTTTQPAQSTQTTTLKTYLIEREIPGAGKLTPEQLKTISQTSCKVLKEMGPQIEWVHSYVTGDKIFCVYRAENEALIREHAKRGGFPVNSITPIATKISPATAQ